MALDSGTVSQYEKAFLLIFLSRTIGFRGRGLGKAILTPLVVACRLAACTCKAFRCAFPCPCRSLVVSSSRSINEIDTFTGVISQSEFDISGCTCFSCCSLDGLWDPFGSETASQAWGGLLFFRPCVCLLLLGALQCLRRDPWPPVKGGQADLRRSAIAKNLAPFWSVCTRVPLRLPPASFLIPEARQLSTVEGRRLT